LDSVDETFSEVVLAVLVSVDLLALLPFSWDIAFFRESEG
jgi:hypothetical protein